MTRPENQENELFRSVLQPLETANLALEHHHQLRKLVDFQQRFSTLEMKYAQIYAQATGLSKRLSDYKSML
jgi:hypothetical protein